MITLNDCVLEECRDRARESTSVTESADLGIAYIDLLKIKYEIELCYAEKQMLDANPFLRYLR